MPRHRVQGAEYVLRLFVCIAVVGATGNSMPTLVKGKDIKASASEREKISPPGPMPITF